MSYNVSYTVMDIYGVQSMTCLFQQVPAETAVRSSVQSG